MTQRTNDLILSCMNQTLRNHDDELTSLISALDIFDSFFQIEGGEYEAHYKKITWQKSKSKTSFQHKNRYYLKLAQLGIHPITEICIDLWTELGTAIRSLIIGNYSSVYGSLRWIIESMMFWTDIHSEKENFIELFEFFRKDEPRLSQNQFSKLYYHEFEMAHILPDEQLRLKEKFDRRHFEETTSKAISVFRNYNVNKDMIETISKTLGSLYKEFSALGHISSHSLEMMEKERLEDYRFFLRYSYSKQKFENVLEKIWQVVDLTTSILIMLNSKFYYYESTREYCKSIKLYYTSQSNIRKIMNFDYDKIQAKLPVLFLLVMLQVIVTNANKFSPNFIKIKIGDTIEWINNDQRSHTLTSGNGPKDPAKGKHFDSHLEIKGKVSHRFSSSGEFEYFCKNHPSKKGKVVVLNN